MRRLELTTALPVEADAAWAVFVDTDRWSEWGRLVRSAEGAWEPGARWRMSLSGDRVMTPSFVEAGERRIVFETVVGHASLARMEHRFDLEPAEHGSVLRQTFLVTGVLVPVLWPVLHRGMAQFDELGEDLARRLATA